ncbi:host cell division inhibitor Icd-like protein [Acerihabitans sp. TG2]|uniref:host cell division inhibitor Icd-like protein n=1 Tax=Acerihabitans sp. TG2 TaxID=3096008 RepID=UPI002B2286E8|nr:host cell division inhibitor Icd-like protein [Acerihabitans sp. TG2]MEA9393407.1 host cell division inhibitor Icd-like protein [Acerihabitans sp. TG2]
MTQWRPPSWRTSVFARVRHSVANNRPCGIRAIAAGGHGGGASQSIARDLVLLFADRLPVQEVA